MDNRLLDINEAKENVKNFENLIQKLIETKKIVTKDNIENGEFVIDINTSKKEEKLVVCTIISHTESLFGFYPIDKEYQESGYFSESPHAITYDDKTELLLKI